MSSPTKAPEVGSPRTSGFSTIAAFSPAKTPTTSQKGKSVLVRQNSPLLLATPPQITRALAFSHPFLLPLNKVVGLISWSSGDPWESFLVVASFSGLVLYGDLAIRWAGPVVVVAVLILGLYSRRYSPLSSTSSTGEGLKGHKRGTSEGSIKQQKSLEEILDTLNTLTNRCHILLDPLLKMTDFLSTQQTATSATTRPALMTLLLRVLLITPLWAALAVPPFRIITSQRIVLIVGTVALSWHSRPARVTRIILWRFKSLRYVASITTGFNFMEPGPQRTIPPPLPPRGKSQQDVASSLASSGQSAKAGVRFTFTVYENQRRWLGLGWTSSLFSYERGPWTDEHLNPSQPKDAFELPVVQSADSRWQWVPGSEWRHEGGGKPSAASSNKSAAEGWVYYDNKWNDGRREDGWGRYTRRRKWYRDAELVEAPADKPTELPATEPTADGISPPLSKASKGVVLEAPSTTKSDDDGSSKRRSFFRSRRESKGSGQSSTYSGKALLLSDDEQDHLVVPDRSARGADWDVGDEVKMGLG